MALPANDVASRMLGLLDDAEPALRDAFLGAILAMQRSSSLDELVLLLEQGRIEEALSIASSAGAISLADEAAAVFTLAGRDGARFIGESLELVVSFDQVNSQAVSVMQQERLRLISGFTSEQLNATRTALVDGIQRGLNPVEQARNFRGSIGLTERQVSAVQTYRGLVEQGSTEALRRELRDKRFDRTVRRASRTKEPIASATVDRMVERYQERQLTFRATTIAQTEALRAVNQGTEESFRQAMMGGLLDPDQLERKWHTAGDERVRSSHRRLNGETRAVGEDFKTNLRFPGDPRASAKEVVRCRCVLTHRIDVPTVEGRVPSVFEI